VGLRDSAARDFFEPSLHNIDAQPSGEITEYVAFSSINTRSPTPMASAPPLPPSPITIVTIGTDRENI